MTDQELKDIVSAVVAELEKSGVDFDYKAEQAKDDDLVFVIRGTAPNYQGVTVTWKGLLDIITAQATQAKTDAVNAKDIAQQILTQVQSKGTEITNFVATSKTEIETQKNESVNAVKSVYQTDLNELKGDLNDLESCVYTEKEDSIPVANIAGITKKTGYNATIDTTNGINIQALSGYDTYYFVASEAMQVYVDETVPANKYYALSIGRNYTGINDHGNYYTLQSESPIRYRNNENNLPTVNNKLTVNVGDVLAFTFTSGSVFSIIGVPVKILNFETAKSGTYTKTASELQITTNKARYIFKRITDNSINVDTWRLYSGELKRLNGTLFEMWSGSDAEGVVQISGEDDFIGGYHGDEIMTNIRIFADGVDITSESSKTDKFDVISIYVESDVYHCNTSGLASTVAFKRNKWLKFEREKVRVGNEWTAQSALSIASAPLALFQCYYKENEVEVATDYMANSDYKLYQMSTPATHTPNSKDSTEFMLETKINPIRFKSIKTNGVNPMGVVAYNFISGQNRVKFYYYTIYSTTAIANGDKLISEFEFEIGK